MLRPQYFFSFELFFPIECISIEFFFSFKKQNNREKIDCQHNVLPAIITIAICGNDFLLEVKCAQQHRIETI